MVALTAARLRTLLALVSLIVAAAPGVDPATAASPGWVLVSTPNTTSTLNAFSAVATVSSTDIWAVGYHDVPNPLCCSGGTIPAPLVQHWDGASWSIVPAPNPNSNFGGSLLQGAAAASGTDVWAVGFTTAVITQPLIEHWDGATWSVVPSPSVQGSLAAVAVVSANDVWATGIQSIGAPGPAAGTLVEHWNGSTWTVVASPNAGNRQNQLVSIAVASVNDVWAVGYNSFTGRAPFYLPLIEHWNGANWSVVPSPSTVDGSLLQAVAAVSAGDVWATGVGLDATATPQPLFLHWNGSAWVSVPSPGGSGACTGCSGGLAVVAANDIWAVGSTIAHWDGVRWTLVDGATLPAGTTSRLNAVARVNASDVWAVGSATANGVTSTLAERFQGGIVPAISLSGLTISPTQVAAGQTATGTVQLSGPSPSGGALVGLSSSYTVAATVPSSVLVPAGASGAQFAIATADPGFQATVVITATYAGTSQGAALIVGPGAPAATLSALTFSPATVRGGSSVTGTVTLSGQAPASGVVVSLSSSSPQATLPSSVLVPAGASGVSFTVATQRVRRTTTLLITATQAGLTRTATLTLTR